MRKLSPWLVFLAISCDPPGDLGKPCVLPNPDGGPGVWITPTNTNDYLYNGTAECQDLVCLRPAYSQLDAGYGFCSNTCTQKDTSDPNSPSDDCAGSSIPMVCRVVLLDSTFIMQIEAEDGGQALLDEYLGGNTPPTLCTTACDGGC